MAKKKTVWKDVSVSEKKEDAFQEFYEVQNSCHCLNPKIIIESKAWGEMMGLCKAMNAKEWGGELKVEKRGEIYYLSDLRIPKQEVTPVTWTSKETERLPGYNCVVHSHSAMSVSPSSTDKKYLEGGYKISLIINNLGDASAIVQVDLDCGKVGRGEAEIEIEIPEGFLGNIKDAPLEIILANTFPSSVFPFPQKAKQLERGEKCPFFSENSFSKYGYSGQCKSKEDTVFCGGDMKNCSAGETEKSRGGDKEVAYMD